MSQSEKNNILDQHKSLYDGYVTKYNQESNQTPVYVQDLANDKMGLTVNNKGVVKNYTNMNINEIHTGLDMIGGDTTKLHDNVYHKHIHLKNGTVDVDDMSDELYSPSKDEYMTSGYFNDKIGQNLDYYEYDIDEPMDYSLEDIREVNVDGEESYEETGLPLDEIEEDDMPEVFEEIMESLDMFKRFEKYN